LADEPTVGYISLSRFSGESVNEVTAAIEELREQGATGFVLDLRQNGGGLRDAAVDVADLFLDEAAGFEIAEHIAGQLFMNCDQTKGQAVFIVAEQFEHGQS
jgi:carboxyl-terminal processing protease